MGAALDIGLTFGPDVSELKTLVTLGEGSEVLNSDSLVVNVDAFKFEELESDFRTDFQDNVLEDFVPISTDESRLDRLKVPLD